MENSVNQEKVSKLPATNFTQNHFDICESFLTKVVSLIHSTGTEAKTYAIDNSSWEDKESIKISIDQKTTLSISLSRSK